MTVPIGNPWLSGRPNVDDRLSPCATYVWDINTATWIPYISNTKDAIHSVVSAIKTDTLIFPTNINRRGGIIYNNSSGDLYLAFGFPATTSSFTVKVENKTFYNIPFGYTGEIRGVWSNTNGEAQITSLE